MPSRSHGYTIWAKITYHGEIPVTVREIDNYKIDGSVQDNDLCTAAGHGIYSASASGNIQSLIQSAKTSLQAEYLHYIHTYKPTTHKPMVNVRFDVSSNDGGITHQITTALSK